MYFVFRDWSDFVIDNLDNVEKSDSAVNEARVNELAYLSAGMKEKVQNAAIEYMLGKSRCREKKQYIRLLQIMIVNLLDRLSSTSISTGGHGNDVARTFSLQLQGTLQFLQENFEEYFDSDQRLPLAIFDQLAKEISGIAAALAEAAAKAPAPIRSILEIVIRTLRDLCNQKNTPTYAQTAYHLELGRKLLRSGSLLTETALTATLFDFNYNHPALCGHIGKQVEAAAQRLKTKSARMLLLMKEQKRINQYVVRAVACLYPQLPSLPGQLNDWISEEINFLQKDELSEESGDSAYVHVPFRGTEIYLLHKSFIDAGGAAGETYKSLFEKTAAHLVNNNQKGFSIDSLQKNGDKVNFEAKDNVKRFLQKMIRNIDSY